MRSKDFVSAFFIATSSGHYVQKWKGTNVDCQVDGVKFFL